MHLLIRIVVGIFIVSLAACNGATEMPAGHRQFPVDTTTTTATVGPSPHAEQQQSGLVGEAVGPGSPIIEKNIESATTEPFRINAPEVRPYVLLYHSDDDTMWLTSIDTLNWHGASTGDGVVWVGGSQDGDRIIGVEGSTVSSLGRRESMSRIFNGQEPVHLTVRSKSGSIRSVEAYSRKEGIKKPATP